MVTSSVPLEAGFILPHRAKLEAPIQRECRIAKVCRQRSDHDVLPSPPRPSLRRQIAPAGNLPEKTRGTG